MDNLFLAFLRGINVSGKNPIKMEQLRTLLINNNFFEVQTYIQSGNIIFKHNETDKEKISQSLYDIIRNNFGFEVPVFVYSQEDFKVLATTNPFNEEAINEPTKVLVSFLSEMTPKLNYKEIFNDIIDEKYSINDNHIFIYCPKGYGKSKLNNNYIERKLKVKATTRNWKTILKLSELLLNFS